MAAELTAEMVMRLGGWDRRYARVLVIATHRGAGLALVDSNGDEANVDVEHYWQDEGGEWVVGSSSGPVSTEIGISSWGEGGRPDRDGYAGYIRCVYGRAACAGPHRVSVPAWERDIEVIAAEGGWWAWIESIQPPLGPGAAAGSCPL